MDDSKSYSSPIVWMPIPLERHHMLFAKLVRSDSTDQIPKRWVLMKIIFLTVERGTDGRR
jgi:hypothetical protein